VTSDQLPIRA